MTRPARNFFSSALNCLGRTKEQREFEETLYLKGLEQEQEFIVEKLNESISSKELALKFVLQELDVARNGDTFSQSFVKKSGFGASEYVGALEKFPQSQVEIDKIQLVFIDFLNKISDETTMYQMAMNSVNAVMEHWELGKYDENREDVLEEEEEGEAFVQEHQRSVSSSLSLQGIKATVMEKLIIADDKIQELIDTFKKPKQHVLTKEEAFKKEFEDIVNDEEAKKAEVRAKVQAEVEEPKEEVVEAPARVYSDDEVDTLMEKHSDVIKEIITGQMRPESKEEIETFQSEISLATDGGHSLAAVFCTFFATKSTLPILEMDESAKVFFLKILTTFEEQGFSESLHDYLEKNGQDVYALASEGDQYMQYLVAFWYVMDDEDQEKAKEDQYLWYQQSARNGCELAARKLQILDKEGR